MNSEQTILKALQILAGLDPDMARERNNVGFNGVDGQFGHDLAKRERLTVKQQLAALKMLRKYTKQLARYGIDIASVKVEEVSALTVSINTNSQYYVVRFSRPAPQYTNLFKAITGFKFVPEKENAWVLPRNAESEEIVTSVVVAESGRVTINKVEDKKRSEPAAQTVEVVETKEEKPVKKSRQPRAPITHAKVVVEKERNHGKATWFDVECPECHTMHRTISNNPVCFECFAKTA